MIREYLIRLFLLVQLVILYGVIVTLAMNGAIHKDFAMLAVLAFGALLATLATVMQIWEATNE